MQMSDLSYASAGARMWQDRRQNAAVLLHFAMLGPYGSDSEEEGQDSAILLHIFLHISRNCDFDRGTPCKCPI